ncbi:MAG: cytochrome b/b6 domain-containing protein [Erythrobacter sp.]
MMSSASNKSDRRTDPALLMAAVSQTKIAIWDWPVRVTHWAFALIIPAMWWTAENSQMGWHKRLGLLLLALVIFRFLWGLAGTETARFARFVKAPATLINAVIAALSRKPGPPEEPIGHGTIGGWSTLVLLGAILTQISLGLFAGDPFDGATGPLNSLVGVSLADRLTDWHETFFWALIGLIAVHLCAIAFYHFVSRRNLVGPMISGMGQVNGLDIREGAALKNGISPASLPRVLACAAISALIVAAIASGILVPA